MAQAFDRQVDPRSRQESWRQDGLQFWDSWLSKRDFAAATISRARSASVKQQPYSLTFRSCSGENSASSAAPLNLPPMAAESILYPCRDSKGSWEKDIWAVAVF